MHKPFEGPRLHRGCTETASFGPYGGRIGTSLVVDEGGKFYGNYKEAQI